MLEKRLTFWMILVFLTLCENKNITKSASIVNVSQSGFSRLIIDFEGVFKKKMFARDAGQFELTIDGCLFEKYALNVMRRYDEIFLPDGSKKIGCIGSSRGITERQVEVFLIMASIKNFSKAAHVLGLSQPSVSRHIKSLEDVFKTPLFKRGDADGVRLTPEGWVLLPKLDDLYDAYLEATNFLVVH